MSNRQELFARVEWYDSGIWQTMDREGHLVGQGHGSEQMKIGMMLNLKPLPKSRARVKLVSSPCVP